MENQKNISNSINGIIKRHKDIQKLHQQIEDKKKEVNSDYSVRTYTREARQQELDNLVAECNAKEVTLRREMADSIRDIAGTVCSAFEPSSELAQQIDFLSTMARGGMLSNNMISNVAEKYRGSETSLLYLRQKLNEAGVKSTPIDSMLFSGSEVDINGNAHFVPPVGYFETLANEVESGSVSDTMLFYNLDNISSKSGAESDLLAEYHSERAKRLEEMSTATPSLI